MTTQKKRDSEWGVAVEEHQCTPFIVGVHEEGSSPNQPPQLSIPLPSIFHSDQNHKTFPADWFSELKQTAKSSRKQHQGWAQIESHEEARVKRVKADFGASYASLVKG